jgi:hypothetical protein
VSVVLDLTKLHATYRAAIASEVETIHSGGSFGENFDSLLALLNVVSQSLYEINDSARRLPKAMRKPSPTSGKPTTPVG